MESTTLQYCFKTLKAYIYPTDTMKETYILELKPDGALSVSMGMRRNDNVDSNNFLDISLSKVKILEQSELFEISRLLKDLETTNEISKKLILDDSWEVTIYYNGRRYNFDFREHKEESVGLLLRLLINYSPLKIDLHSWS